MRRTVWRGNERPCNTSEEDLALGGGRRSRPFLHKHRFLLAPQVQRTERGAPGLDLRRNIQRALLGTFCTLGVMSVVFRVVASASFHWQVLANVMRRGGGGGYKQQQRALNRTCTRSMRELQTCICATIIGAWRTWSPGRRPRKTYPWRILGRK